MLIKTPGGLTTAIAVENYITLFLLLFKACPWGTEANRWIRDEAHFQRKQFFETSKYEFSRIFYSSCC